ncbi:MAG: hypothetical protein E7381_04670 [Clostridiales bacterium]|nr:hypothetical protein [Clostridiales bacterium]
MKKSAFISDVLFAFLLVAVFTLCLFRYLRIPMLPAFLLCLLCGTLSAMGVGTLLQAKRKTLFLKQSEESQKERLLTHLALLSDEQKTNYFQEIFSREGEVKRFSRLRLATQNAFYFLYFRFSPVTADEVASVSRLKTAQDKVLLCNRIDEGAVELCAKLNIRLQTGESVYKRIKEANALPQTYLGEEQKESKRKRRIRFCFAKSNAKRFFIGGALILLTSLFTPFPYYYFITGSILLVVALLIRIFGYS